MTHDDENCGCDHSVGENCPECYAPSFDKPDICGETIVDKVTGLMEACPNLMPCKDHETLDRSADALSQVLQVCRWLVADLTRYELSEQSNNDENFNMHAHIGILRGRHMGLTNEMPKILDDAIKIRGTLKRALERAFDAGQARMLGSHEHFQQTHPDRDEAVSKLLADLLQGGVE